MWGVRVAAVIALSLPLAGCFGIWPPKELPDWAINPQRVEAAAPVRAKTVRRVNGALDQSANISFVTPMADVMPFSREWQARENAFDERLRRRMNICRGC